MKLNKTSRGGPNTPLGKNTSSRNATDHGMCQQRFLLLPGESPEEFAVCRNMWREQYDLDEPAVPSLVEILAESDWMLRRCTRNVCLFEMRLAEMDQMHPNNLEGIDHLEKRLQNAYRYKTAAENSFTRALRNLERFRKSRYDEDLKDAQFELKRVEVIDRCVTRRHKLGLTTETALETILNHEFQNDESATRRRESHPQPAPSGSKTEDENAPA